MIKELEAIEKVLARIDVHRAYAEELAAIEAFKKLRGKPLEMSSIKFTECP